MSLLGGTPDIEKLKAKRNVGGLIKALGYREKAQVRHDAAIALGRLRDAQALVPLVDALKDEEALVRQAAAWALGQLGDARVAKLLLPLLKDQNAGVRFQTARALGYLGDAQAVPLLYDIASFNVEDWHVRQAAAWALDKLGWQPDESAVGAIYWIVKRQWGECVEIGGAAVEPLATALNKDENAEVKTAALEALSAIGGLGLRALIAATESPDEDVRRRAAMELMRLYTQGRLTEQERRMVLAQMGVIQQYAEVEDSDK